MAILIDPNESRDRRLKMLLDTATTAMQIQNQKQENDLRLRQLSQQTEEAKALQDYRMKDLALKDPAQNKYLRAQLATENRARLSDARYKDNAPSFQEKQNAMLERQLAFNREVRDYKGSEASPMSADAAGRYQFAEEALRNIPKLKQMIFSGNNGEFRQDIAIKLMYPWKYPKDKEVQNAKRWITGIATGRGLIQSGVTLRPDEWVRLMDNLGINAFSAPEAVMDSLNENEEFYSGFKKLVRPGGSGDEKDVPKLTGKAKSLYDKYAGA